MTFPSEGDGEEDDVDSLVDPGDSATEAQREAAVARIRANVKRIKQRQTALGHVSNKLLFSILNPKLVLEDILDLIVSRLSPDIFIDHHPTTMYKPNLDMPHIKHMYTKFKFAYVIQLYHTSADFSTPQLFTGVLTPHTVKKHTIPGVMAKTVGDRVRPKEYKVVLCHFCPFFSGNEGQCLQSHLSPSFMHGHGMWSLL